MLDLSTYRIRIGYFNAKHYNKHAVKDNASTRRHSFCLVLLIIIMTVTNLPDDGRSGKNRQRGRFFTNFTYESAKEKSLFNQIRKTEAKLCRSESHLIFFQHCFDNKVIPENLLVHDKFQLAFTDHAVKENLNTIREEYQLGTCLTSITHFKLQVKQFQEEVTVLKKQLSDVCNQDRYTILMSKLNQHRGKLKYKLNKKKNKKIDKLTTHEIVSKDTNQFWIPDLHLSFEDQSIIQNGDELTDHHIYIALTILQTQFPHIYTQPPSLVQASGFEYCPFETIQIINNESFHWILLSSIGGLVTIFDSLNTTPTDSALQQIKQLFSPDDLLPPYQQTSCIQQHGSKDCGVFAIAYAVDLLHHNQPNSITYDQQKMRAHLLTCFQNKFFTPFPKYSNSSTTEFITSQNSSSQWKMPRRSQRIKSKQVKQSHQPDIQLQNRYSMSIKSTPTVTIPTQNTNENEITNIKNSK